MQAKRTDSRPYCNQLTRRDEPCMQRATWREINKRTGRVELYCTQHANTYGPWRRGGERIERNGS